MYRVSFSFIKTMEYRPNSRPENIWAWAYNVPLSSGMNHITFLSLQPTHALNIHLQFEMITQNILLQWRIARLESNR